MHFAFFTITIIIINIIFYIIVSVSLENKTEEK